MESTSQVDDAAAPAPGTPDRLPLAAWLREGLRAGFLMSPRIRGQQPTPGQMAVLVLLLSLIETGMARLEIAGPAQFDLRGWLIPWWSTAALLMLAWWALPSGGAQRAGRPAGLAAWFALWMGAVFPANLVSLLLGMAQAREALPAWLDGSNWLAWAVYLGLWAWIVVVALQLSASFGVQGRRLLALGFGVVALFGVGVWQFPDRPWQPDLAAESAPPQLALSQETFETQQDLWRTTQGSLAPQRPGIVDVYGLVFSPYAGEDVFRRESAMVASLLADRFDAGGRVVHLLNHAATAASHPWATPLNLERAIEALGQRMDRQEDVLVVYLTSHGASNFALAASHPPLRVAPVSPGELRRMLDQAGIRHRVVAVSACYSGGWIAPLASDTTLVMTAADATHTSYGCGRLSELTFFGRAVFDEALRSTRSFEQAFASAVPVIRQREIDAGKDDGFSNPQISVGDAIKPVLRALEQRLGGAGK